MFSLPDLRLARKKSPDALNSLLKSLGVNANSDDESLDELIEEKICAEINADSILDCYAKLLDLGKIEFGARDTNLDLLRKILNNRSKILQGINESEGETSKSPILYFAGGGLIFAGLIFALMLDGNLYIAGTLFTIGIAGILFGFMNKSKSNPPKNRISESQVTKLLSDLEHVNTIFKSINS